ncbi:MAG TPA: DUF397 domain-containing protein [Pseudonocardiaceae bacterium]
MTTPADDLAWRTASYSGAGENCVEVAPAADGVVIRHSKHPGAGTIAFSYDAWADFLRDASEGGTTNGVAAIVAVGADTVVRSLTGAVELRFDDGEWSAFRAGVADGEFDFTPESALA